MNFVELAHLHLAVGEAAAEGKGTENSLRLFQALLDCPVWVRIGGQQNFLVRCLLHTEQQRKPNRLQLKKEQSDHHDQFCLLAFCLLASVSVSGLKIIVRSVVFLTSSSSSHFPSQKLTSTLLDSSLLLSTIPWMPFELMTPISPSFKEMNFFV